MVTKKEKTEQIEVLKQKLLPVLIAHDVSRASIFGSFAEGTATETSDLDILIEFKGEKSLLDLASLKLDLESETNREVDVLTYRSLNPLIKKRVLKQEIKVL